MQVPPLPMIRDTHLAYRSLRPGGKLDWYREGLHAIRTKDTAAITIALLDVVLAPLECNSASCMLIELHEIADRWRVGRSEE